MSDAMTSRACVVCGWIFHVGHSRSERTRTSLDFHCGKPTRECPTFDPDGKPPDKETGFEGSTAFHERHEAYKAYFSGRTPTEPQPVTEEWWR